jgi:hypothetical protein
MPLATLRAHAGRRMRVDLQRGVKEQAAPLLFASLKQLDAKTLNLYLYVENDPLTARDPSGLYGTGDCSYYDRACQAVAGSYYCGTALFSSGACRTTPNGPWSNCVRKCLQDCDSAVRGGPPQPPGCSGTPPPQQSRSASGADTALCHIACWTDCVVVAAGGGDP